MHDLYAKRDVVHEHFPKLPKTSRTCVILRSTTNADEKQYLDEGLQ